MKPKKLITHQTYSFLQMNLNHRDSNVSGLSAAWNRAFTRPVSVLCWGREGNWDRDERAINMSNLKIYWPEWKAFRWNRFSYIVKLIAICQSSSILTKTDELSEEKKWTNILEREWTQCSHWVSSLKHFQKVLRQQYHQTYTDSLFA